MPYFFLNYPIIKSRKILKTNLFLVTQQAAPSPRHKPKRNPKPKISECESQDSIDDTIYDVAKIEELKANEERLKNQDKCLAIKTRKSKYDKKTKG